MTREWISLSGGLSGPIGPEVMASMVDHQLSTMRFGLSQGFRHAFDTVDLRLMKAP